MYCKQHAVSPFNKTTTQEICLILNLIWNYLIRENVNKILLYYVQWTHFSKYQKVLRFNT